jgi:hypothetical protein
MFACMRIACGGEDIEKKYRRENERWCITPIRGYIQSRFKECVCVSLSSGAATQHACQKLFSKYNMYRKQRAAVRRPNNVKT